MCKKVPDPLGDIDPTKISEKTIPPPPPPTHHLSLCHCVPPRKPKFEPLFIKITIHTFSVTFANS